MARFQRLYGVVWCCMSLILMLCEFNDYRADSENHYHLFMKVGGMVMFSIDNPGLWAENDYH